MLLQTLLISTLPLLAFARTDLVGCTSSVSGPSLVWYVPDTGELCDFLDCGGGTAPPKTTVAGCPLYSGTATYSPSYLPGWGPDGKSAEPTSSTLTSALATATESAPAESSPAVTGAANLTTSTHTSGAVTTPVSNGTVNLTPTPSVQSTNSGTSVVVPLAAIGAALLGLAAFL
jgi:hypothetical protein